ncbi:polyprenyl synthetase family protein [soil metagenome]
MTTPSTTSGTSTPAPLSFVATLTDQRLTTFLAAERTRWAELDPDLDLALGELDRFCRDGGKRVRPAFAYWTYLGASGNAEDASILDLCAGLELLHAFALLHDDVMDGSDLRRHHETVHVAAARRHRESAWRGESRRFGEGVAILLGDLALTYADQLMSPLDAATRSVYSELKTELMVGQYMDLVSAARGDVDGDRGRRIVLYKSAKYTVERPMHLGAALAGRFDDLAEPLTRVGLPLGEAFQLRDDLLGVFGSEEAVGKPVGDDLREGEATRLLTFATERAEAAQLRELARVCADLDADTVERLCQIIEDTGARSTVERRIDELTDGALAELECIQMTGPARTALVELATYVGRRER